MPLRPRPPVACQVIILTELVFTMLTYTGSFFWMNDLLSKLTFEQTVFRHSDSRLDPTFAQSYFQKDDPKLLLRVPRYSLLVKGKHSKNNRQEQVTFSSAREVIQISGSRVSIPFKFLHEWKVFLWQCIKWYSCSFSFLVLVLSYHIKEMYLVWQFTQNIVSRVINLIWVQLCKIKLTSGTFCNIMYVTHRN